MIKKENGKLNPENTNKSDKLENKKKNDNNENLKNDKDIIKKEKQQQ